MIPAERQALILSRLSKKGVMSIAQLSDLLQVSQMTVRRDIRILEDDGRATSVVGGVQLSQQIADNSLHISEISNFNKEKIAIGAYAAKLIKPGSVIYLDAGTTTLEIAHNLHNIHDVTVITNDFIICSFLAQHSHCRLFHIGGEVARKNKSTVGFIAADMVQRFNFDYAFLSTSSLSSFDILGISTSDEHKFVVKRKVIKKSINKYLVADSSKYGAIEMFNIISLDQLTSIITDVGLPTNIIDIMNHKDIKLRLVDTE